MTNKTKQKNQINK